MKNFISKYKGKILLTIFFTFLLLILNNNVFATFDFTYEDVDYSLADLPFDTSLHPHFIIIKNVGRTYSYQVAYPASEYDLPYIYYSTGDPSGIRYFLTGSSTNGQWNYHNYTSGSWSSVKTTSKYTISYEANRVQEGYAVYSTVDIYDTEGTLFFQKTLVTEIPETTIPALETVEQIPTAMVETLKMIVPVGLAIFGIVLLISLIKLVILQMT